MNTTWETLLCITQYNLTATKTISSKMIIRWINNVCHDLLGIAWKKVNDGRLTVKSLKQVGPYRSIIRILYRAITNFKFTIYIFHSQHDQNWSNKLLKSGNTNNAEYLFPYFKDDEDGWSWDFWHTIGIRQDSESLYQPDYYMFKVFS